MYLSLIRSETAQYPVQNYGLLSQQASGHRSWISFVGVFIATVYPFYHIIVIAGAHESPKAVKERISASY